MSRQYLSQMFFYLAPFESDINKKTSDLLLREINDKKYDTIVIINHQFSE